MNDNYLIRNLCIVFFAITIISCKETPPYINLIPSHVSSDSTSLFLPAPTPEEKHVLIEEFTGVQCANCPAAQREAASIITNHPTRQIHVISIHPKGKNDPLTRPFDMKVGDAHTSKYDFRTFEGAQLYDLVGPGAGGSFPTGNIDRKLYSGEAYRNINYQNWVSHVNTELSLPTPVNISLTAKNSGDSIAVEITLIYTDFAVDTPHYLTLSIIESGMIDFQESTDPNGKQIIEEFYVHNHVLRGIITDYYGDVLKAKLEPGRIFFRKYSYKRNPLWITTNLDVVAIIHLNTGKLNVIHSKETHVN